MFKNETKGYILFLQSSMSNLSRFNAGNNYHSVFGEGGDTSTPPLLDLSEFPSLTARGAGDQAPTTAPPPPGSKPYGEQTHFIDYKRKSKENSQNLTFNIITLRQ